MSYQIHLTQDALQDLQDIDDYIIHHDSPENADYVLGEIEKVINKLTELPERGSFPEELLVLGIKEYREVYFKPYRIIYRILNRNGDDRIYVYFIADGRRDLQSMLRRRLLISW
ncbi:MAG: type II toxin-antitoxin system RelE/ParE family toxin [Methylococcaceae bacterium]